MVELFTETPSLIEDFDETNIQASAKISTRVSIGWKLATRLELAEIRLLSAQKTAQQWGSVWGTVWDQVLDVSRRRNIYDD